MDTVKLNKTIDVLNKSIMSMNLSQHPIGLFHGKMGLSIYFFYLSRLQNNCEYKTFAESLLMQVYQSVDTLTEKRFGTGLSGIGWGIHHLLEEGFVSGDFDEVLKDIDDSLYYSIHFSWTNDEAFVRCDFIWLLFYYVKRLNTIRKKEELILAQKTVSMILNHIEDCYSDEPWGQPYLFNLQKYELALYLWVLSELYRYGFCKNKIDRIWEGLNNVVLSSFPTLQANRLFLLTGIRNVLKRKPMPQWEQHANLLQEHIHYNELSTSEFLDKDITLRRGICGCYILNLISGNAAGELNNFVLRRIEMSGIWDDRFCVDSNAFQGNIGLADGVSGVSLIYSFLQNLYKI